MARIQIKKQKKLVTLHQRELVGQLHSDNVRNALSAFSESNVVSEDGDGEWTVYTYSFNGSIPTKIIESALNKLQLKIDL